MKTSFPIDLADKRFEKRWDNIERSMDEMREDLELAIAIAKDLCHQRGIDPHAHQRPKLTLIKGGKA